MSKTNICSFQKVGIDFVVLCAVPFTVISLFSKINLMTLYLDNAIRPWLRQLFITRTFIAEPITDTINLSLTVKPLSIHGAI